MKENGKKEILTAKSQSALSFGGRKPEKVMKENGKKEILTAKSQSALSFGGEETGEGDEGEWKKRNPHRKVAKCAKFLGEETGEGDEGEHESAYKLTPLFGSGSLTDVKVAADGTATFEPLLELPKYFQYCLKS
jgi:hypothetical protein